VVVVLSSADVLVLKQSKRAFQLLHTFDSQLFRSLWVECLVSCTGKHLDYLGFNIKVLQDSVPGLLKTLEGQGYEK